MITIVQFVRQTHIGRGDVDHYLYFKGKGGQGTCNTACRLRLDDVLVVGCVDTLMIRLKLHQSTFFPRTPTAQDLVQVPTALIYSSVGLLLFCQHARWAEAVALLLCQALAGSAPQAARSLCVAIRCYLHDVTCTAALCC